MRGVTDRFDTGEEDVDDRLNDDEQTPPGMEPDLADVLDEFGESTVYVVDEAALGSLLGAGGDRNNEGGNVDPPPGPGNGGDGPGSPARIDGTLMSAAMFALLIILLGAFIAMFEIDGDHLGRVVLFAGLALLLGGLIAAAAHFASQYRTETKVEPVGGAGDRRFKTLLPGLGEAIGIVTTTAEKIGSAPVWIGALSFGTLLLAMGALMEGYTFFGNDVLDPGEIERTEVAVAAACERAEHAQAVAWTATAGAASAYWQATRESQEVAWTATASDAAFARMVTGTAQAMAWTVSAAGPQVSPVAGDPTATSTPAPALPPQAEEDGSAEAVISGADGASSDAMTLPSACLPVLSESGGAT